MITSMLLVLKYTGGVITTLGMQLKAVKQELVLQ
jgi:hypothetical protein